MLRVTLAHVLGLDQGAAAIKMQLVAEFGIEASRARAAAELQQRRVEIEVPGVVGGGLIGAPGRFHALHQGAQRGKLRGRANLRQPRAGEARDGGADVVDLERFLGAHLPDIAALVAHGDHQAAAFQAPHRLSHRTAGDAKACGKRRFVQAFPGGKAAGEDHPLDLLRDEGGEGAGAYDIEGGRPRCGHRRGCLGHRCATSGPGPGALACFLHGREAASGDCHLSTVCAGRHRC